MGKVTVAIISALLSATITASAILGQINNDLPNLEPTTDLSAVRMIWCHDPKEANPRMGWQGSGSVIANGVILTALHVANGDNCQDVATGLPLKMYAQDKDHDIALMSGITPNVPYLKYSCEPYKKGKVYLAYGISGYMRGNPIFRENLMEFKGKYEDVDMDTGTEEKHMASFDSPTVPGMSGGPYADIHGVIHGIINAGVHDPAGIPMKTSYSFQLADSPLICHK